MNPSVRPAKIRKLDEATIREIAAGEVIERPASVVKELVENALDAGAREIRVRLDGGGLELIEVADDGCGIPAEDFPLVFERHATSKLRDASYLVDVTTLGFRGEALASIAAVSHVRLTSRAGGGSAHQMDASGSRLAATTETARAPGTTVEVRDLFFNTPARRKFLRSPTSETLQVAETVERLYAANPSVAFTLLTDRRERARFSPSKSLREAAAHLLGVEFAERAFEFRGTGGAGVWIEGLASHPSLTRGTAGRMFFAVNGRAITSRALQDGLRAAYLDVVPRGRFPLALVRLTVEPGYVDVNVHPTKREVRFQDEAELRESVRTLVRSALQSAPLPSLPPSNAGPSRMGAERFSSGQAPIQRTLAGTRHPPRPIPDSPEVSATVGDYFQAASMPVQEGGGLHVLGQVGDLYIVAESADEEGSLVLIDAHAASERVIFERLQAASVHGHQSLLAPVDLELTPSQCTTWETHREEILGLGFEVEPFGGRHFRVLAVPAFLWHRVEASRLGGLLDELGDTERSTVRESLHDRVAKTVACHMAIRGGDPLTLAEMHRLIQELGATPNHFTCPHGRPVMVSLPRTQLNRWFQR